MESYGKQTVRFSNSTNLPNLPSSPLNGPPLFLLLPLLCIFYLAISPCLPTLSCSCPLCFLQSLALAEIEAIVAEIEKEKEQGTLPCPRRLHRTHAANPSLHRGRTKTRTTRRYRRKSSADGSGVGRQRKRQWNGNPGFIDIRTTVCIFFSQEIDSFFLQPLLSPSPYRSFSFSLTLSHLALQRTVRRELVVHYGITECKTISSTVGSLRHETQSAVKGFEVSNRVGQSR